LEKVPDEQESHPELEGYSPKPHGMQAKLELEMKELEGHWLGRMQES